MKVRTVVLAISAFAIAAPGAVATAAERAPNAIFRISANGPSPDNALKDVTQIISERCAASGFVIVNNQIKQSADGSFYYGSVSARCTA